MPLILTESNFPFDLKRIQFPIRPAFAMSINKGYLKKKKKIKFKLKSLIQLKIFFTAQGQSLGLVGLWLEDPVFTHGQLYVALSRVSSADHIKISVGKNESNYTKNIVFSNVFES
jgi:hypothetical protein